MLSKISLYKIAAMSNLIGLGVSYVFVGLVLAAAAFLQSRFGISPGVTRKIIHISVSHWWLILMAFFDTLAFAVIGPVSFIIINYLSYRYHLMPAMELEDNRKNLGTVYFPCSLLILVILSFSGYIPIYAGAVGILIMGYGDGLASVFGERWGIIARTFRGGTKSLTGTLVMFFMSALVTVLITLWFHPLPVSLGSLAVLAVLTAAAATAVELITPWGMDNLSVPIISALVYSGLV